MRRPVLLAACALAAATVLPADAAPKPQIEDAKGDALNSAGANDIVSATYAVVGSKLVVSLELAAPPSSQAGMVYGLESDVAGCGYWQYMYSPGATLGEGDLFVECGTETPDETGSTAAFLGALPKVEGNKIVWSISTKGLPKAVKKGSTFSGFRAYAAVAEPVFGIIGTDFLSSLGAPANLDDATGAGSWKLP